MALHESDQPTAPVSSSRREPRRGWLLLWAALFAGLAGAFALDGPIMGAVRPLQDSPFAHFLRATVRWLGTGHVQAGVLVILLCLGAVFSRRLLRAAGLSLLAGALSGVCVTVLKVLVHRARPDALVPAAGSWGEHLRQALHDSSLRSFPSGESTTTFAIAWVMAYAFPRWRSPLLALAAVIAIARVLVGSHHPSDVWAGAMLGIAAGQWVVGRARRRDPQGPEGAG
jgi:membrane-associated phospholipid phosphatase